MLRFTDTGRLASDHESCEEKNGGSEAEHGGVESVAFDLADEGDHEDLVAHGVEHVVVGRLGHGLDVTCVSLGEDVSDAVFEGVEDPVVGLVVADEEFRATRAEDAGGRLDGGKMTRRQTMMERTVRAMKATKRARCRPWVGMGRWRAPATMPESRVTQKAALVSRKRMVFWVSSVTR